MYFCRTSDKELDGHIFKVFDLMNQGKISKEVMNLIVFNMPMIGFCDAQSFLKADEDNQHIFQEITKYINVDKRAAVPGKPIVAKQVQTHTRSEDCVKAQMPPSQWADHSGEGKTGATQGISSNSVITQNSVSPREQYLSYREQVLDQTQEFMWDKDHLQFAEFSAWIDKFPFMRCYFRECMKPMIWSLQNPGARSIVKGGQSALTRQDQIENQQAK